MNKFLMAFLAMALALAVTPAVMADEWVYAIDGSNFSADLTLFTTPTVAGVATVQSMQGTFQINGQGAVTFGDTAVENAVTAANPNPSANNLTLSSDGEFLFDNLLYTNASGNNILDWGGILVDISGYELNIFSGAFGGSDGTYAPGNMYFYFADNGSYHGNNPIPKSNDPLVQATGALTEVPEPGSLFLLGAGLFGLALALHRKDAKRLSRTALSVSLPRDFRAEDRTTFRVWQTSNFSHPEEGIGVQNELGCMTQDSESAADRRNVRRFKVSAPLTVTVGDRKIPAYTRDLSDRGVYFFVVSDDSKLIDQDIEFMVELPPEITLLPFCWVRCRGRVLRKEASLMSFTGVAAQILDYVILGGAISAA